VENSKKKKERGAFFSIGKGKQRKTAMAGLKE
jgi:hypothetical protein